MKCRLCKSLNISEVFHLKNTLLDGIYGNEKKEINNFTLLKCNSCGLYQLKELIDYNKIYSNYKFTSNTILTISEWMNDLHNIFVKNYDIINKNILEVGASDGCFLNLFKNNNKVIGIEPSKILSQNARINYGIDIVNGFYNKKSFENQKFDLIICRHVIEHIENIEDFINNMIINLSDNGLLYIEVPDIDYIINNLNYTNFFHEHINYFSKKVLEKYMNKLGFENIFFIKNKVHNGSFGMIFKSKKNNKTINKIEKKINIDKEKFQKLIKKYKNIAGYGAANKTFKLISIFDLENKIDIVFDKNQNLWGTFIKSNINIFIKNPDLIGKDKYDAIIIFATSYTKEIINYIKNELNFSGDIILLYPNIEIIN